MSWIWLPTIDGQGETKMHATACERAGPMLNPPHPGNLIRQNMGEVGWNVTESAACLWCGRGTVSRLLNGKAGVSATMARALEAPGCGTADQSLRIQANSELAQARLARGWPGEPGHVMGSRGSAMVCDYAASVPDDSGHGPLRPVKGAKAG